MSVIHKGAELSIVFRYYRISSDQLGLERLPNVLSEPYTWIYEHVVLHFRGYDFFFFESFCDFDVFLSQTISGIPLLLVTIQAGLLERPMLCVKPMMNFIGDVRVDVAVTHFCKSSTAG